MSATLNLTRGYGSFFWECGKFAVSPYTGTFFAIAMPDEGASDADICTNIVAAGIVTGILTFVVPILPVLFSITSALATVAACLAVASMFILYPVALIADLFCSANESTQFSI